MLSCLHVPPTMGSLCWLWRENRFIRLLERSSRSFVLSGHSAKEALKGGTQVFDVRTHLSSWGISGAINHSSTSGLHRRRLPPPLCYCQFSCPHKMTACFQIIKTQTWLRRFWLEGCSPQTPRAAPPEGEGPALPQRCLRGGLAGGLSDPVAPGRAKGGRPGRTVK